MKKRVWFILTPLALLLIAAIAVIGFAQSRALSFTTGRYLKCGDSHMILIEDSGATIMSYDDEDMFDGLSNGDEIKILNGIILTSYPGHTHAYYCRKLADGTEADLPKADVESLRELGWIKHLHEHTAATEENLIDIDFSGYCGNTVTTITVPENNTSRKYSFWGDDSVALTHLLRCLIYDKDAICDCIDNYSIETESGSYSVNLANFYARSYDAQTGEILGQVALSDEQIQTISGIIKKAEKGELGTTTIK